jgi:cytochrome c biogenesis protein CcmG, thiol:disulfide interchange protein DsbE
MPTSTPDSAVPPADPSDPTPEPSRDSAGPSATTARWLWALAAVMVVAAAAVVAVAATGSGSHGSSTGSVTPDHLVGRPLPAVTYTRFDGSTATLAALRGKPLVLNFWSATCVPCRTEMPALERVARREGASATILGIDTGDGHGAGADAARQAGATYPLAFDPRSTIASRLATVALPTTLVVDAQGVVTHVHVGAVDPNDLESWISQARP